MVKMHESVTLDRVMEAAKRQMCSLDNPGICIACGHEQEGCEPDMCQGKCEVCGERKVYGAEELMIMMA